MVSASAMLDGLRQEQFDVQAIIEAQVGETLPGGRPFQAEDY
jgi:hypothetical protein